MILLLVYLSQEGDISSLTLFTIISGVNIYVYRTIENHKIK